MPLAVRATARVGLSVDLHTWLYLYFRGMNNGGRWPWLACVFLVLLVVASCGDGDSDGDDTAEGVGTVTTVSETTGPATSATVDDSVQAPETTASAPETTQAVAETTAAPSPTEAEPETTAEPLGPPAPDFTLQLSDGGTFVLSEQTTPVLMIFWAEW